jgi:hypothetical protein
MVVDDTMRFPVPVPPVSLEVYARERRRQDWVSVWWDLRHAAHMEVLLGHPMWDGEVAWVTSWAARKLMSGPGPRDLVRVSWED